MIRKVLFLGLGFAVAFIIPDGITDSAEAQQCIKCERTWGLCSECNHFRSYHLKCYKSGHCRCGNSGAEGCGGGGGNCDPVTGECPDEPDSTPGLHLSLHFDFEADEWVTGAATEVVRLAQLPAGATPTGCAPATEYVIY